MKHIFTFCIFLFTISTSAQNFNSAVEYLEFVSEQQEGITKKMWRYTKSIAHSRSDRNIENKRKSLLKTLNKAITNVKKAPGYEGNTFKDQLLKRLDSVNLTENECLTEFMTYFPGLAESNDTAGATPKRGNIIIQLRLAVSRLQIIKVVQIHQMLRSVIVR